MNLLSASSLIEQITDQMSILRCYNLEPDIIFLSTENYTTLVKHYEVGGITLLGNYYTPHCIEHRKGALTLLGLPCVRCSDQSMQDAGAGFKVSIKIP